ncbi:MAG: hypothetical protein WC508_01425 [Patescibacteria group bacterium]
MSKTNTPKLEFDANYSLSYGMWRCPECGSESYATLVHKEECRKSGNSDCILVIGPKVIAFAKKQGKNRVGFPSLEEIREQLPNVVGL